MKKKNNSHLQGMSRADLSSPGIQTVQAVYSRP
jgi:hypothetical protein